MDATAHAGEMAGGSSARRTELNQLFAVPGHAPVLCNGSIRQRGHVAILLRGRRVMHVAMRALPALDVAAAASGLGRACCTLLLQHGRCGQRRLQPAAPLARKPRRTRGNGDDSDRPTAPAIWVRVWGTLSPNECFWQPEGPTSDPAACRRRNAQACGSRGGRPRFKKADDGRRGWSWTTNSSTRRRR